MGKGRRDLAVRNLGQESQTVPEQGPRDRLLHTKVRIRTTPKGPWLEDFYWGVHAGSPSPGIVYPQGALGEHELLEALLRRLKGFDNEELIRAMHCTADLSSLV